MPESRESVQSKVPEYEQYGPKFSKAIDAAMGGCVKEALFLPSGRRVYTVVGRMGDEFIDPDKPYCSCSSFYFQVHGAKEPICYHLLGYRIASKLAMVDVVKFSDDEYGDYLSATIHDVLELLGKGGG